MSYVFLPEASDVLYDGILKVQAKPLGYPASGVRRFRPSPPDRRFGAAGFTLDQDGAATPSTPARPTAADSSRMSRGGPASVLRSASSPARILLARQGGSDGLERGTLNTLRLHRFLLSSPGADGPPRATPSRPAPTGTGAQLKPPKSPTLFFATCSSFRKHPGSNSVVRPRPLAPRSLLPSRIPALRSGGVGRDGAGAGDGAAGPHGPFGVSPGRAHRSGPPRPHPRRPALLRRRWGDGMATRHFFLGGGGGRPGRG